MLDITQPILRTDVSGMPLEWIHFRHAVTLITLDQVAYTCGEFVMTVRGGINRLTQCQSKLEVNSILATCGASRAFSKACGKGPDRYTPPLHNIPLFQRDACICLYCGEKFKPAALSRDHVTPFSQGGRDNWNNVVTACVRCNNFKAGRTPEQAGMKLIAIPFTPTHAEYVYLQGRRILADQMEFLKSHFPRTSPLHQRI
ncbi:HNH endonuclease [Candidatus Spongiihabitans sp.]|uniref:HNH endonuclease n=1 Tax=Candidatus Spongiihabitans sp. TaxID=3101308 RepID=UPI003C79F924